MSSFGTEPVFVGYIVDGDGFSVGSQVGEGAVDLAGAGRGQVARLLGGDVVGGFIAIRS